MQAAGRETNKPCAAAPKKYDTHMMPMLHTDLYQQEGVVDHPLRPRAFGRWQCAGHGTCTMADGTGGTSPFPHNGSGRAHTVGKGTQDPLSVRNYPILLSGVSIGALKANQ